MLVLSRKVDESIRIGDAVVTIISVAGGVVKVGIVAPPSVVILRTELETPVDEYQQGDCYFNALAVASVVLCLLIERDTE